MRPLSCFFLLALLTLAARAGEVLPISAEADSHVKIKVSCPLNPWPRTGCGAVEVDIRNNTASRGRWLAIFRSSSGGYSGLGAQANTFESSSEMTVEAGSERTFRLIVPYVSNPNGVLLSMNGPGLPDATMASCSIHNPTIPGSIGPYFGVSHSLAVLGRLDSAKQNFTIFALEELPEDWRALAGFDALWLSVSEWAALSAPQRSALRDWLGRGGALSLFGSAARPDDLKEEGLGRITMREEAIFGAPDFSQLNILPERDKRFAEGYAKTWPAAERLGRQTPSLTVLSLLLLALATINGPVNLFVFAKGARRAQLLWIAPVISLAAGGLLIVYILFHDGVGGQGERYALIHLLPSQNKAAVLQEQVSRTGLLLSSAFQLEHPSLFWPITPEEMGLRQARKFKIQGQDFAGDWATSRSRQGEWLETIVSTRAQVQLVQASETADPEIVSSIEAPLAEIYLRTESGQLWRGQNVRTGEKRALQKCPKLPGLIPDAGTQLRLVLDSVKDRREYFYATTAAGSAFEETLPGIRWKTQQVVYLGPVTRAQP